MKLKSILAVVFCTVAIIAQAQQNIGFRAEKIISPQVNSDNTVTFRLNAPKAKSVSVKGDWEANDGVGTMKKGKEGLWEYTTPVLPSEMYTYRFDIDGVIGLDPHNPFTRRDVGNVFSIFFVGHGPADYYQVHDVPHGTMQTVWYQCQGLYQNNRRMVIYLPPSYDKDNKNYPVLYLMHGSGGDEMAWSDLGFVNRVMDNLIAEGKVEPMIVVMPNGNPSKQAEAGETSENLSYMPVMTNTLPDYKAGKFEATFPQIVNYVDNHYRTLPDKAHRALAGLSMGGFYTMMISANFPELFDYIGLFSAGVDFKGINWNIPVYRDLDRKLAEQYKQGVKLYWIGMGKADRLYPFNLDLMKCLDKAGTKYEYHESSRGHLWSNWRQYLLIFAPQLFK
ncbi:esterase [Segatella buccae]|uniref:Isoamylase N-terminal domain protein n=1 Tax=Segatella buccae ATCC 33574 TaxID=873513 RepID=E6KA31_9BACT|nr:esterase [Segatella buccae]EFU29599.1 isoamylase N-terminal domain protein [Segatella buccae ATCC 33574]